MTGKELRKLGRPQLLELLVAQGKELEALKERLEAAEAATLGLMTMLAEV